MTLFFLIGHPVDTAMYYLAHLLDYCSPFLLDVKQLILHVILSPLTPFTSFFFSLLYKGLYEPTNLSCVSPAFMEISAG